MKKHIENILWLITIIVVWAGCIFLMSELFDLLLIKRSEE